jgi:LPXTG-site transpeptidase (sortase) family protein
MSYSSLSLLGFATEGSGTINIKVRFTDNSIQIFNNLKNVPVGTLVYVKTEDAVHIYKTTKVERVSKYSTWIQFKSEKPMLTLATCDSFGKASDRWVLEAEYVGVQ